MIAPAMIDKIRRMVATGSYSLRQIARLTGVSRGTVAAVAHGKRLDRPSPADDGAGEEPLGPIARCPRCGALAHLPCRACDVHSWQAVHRRGRSAGPVDELPEVTLDLAGDERARYEEIHARRMKEALT